LDTAAVIKGELIKGAQRESNTGPMSIIFACGITNRRSGRFGGRRFRMFQALLSLGKTRIGKETRVATGESREDDELWITGITDHESRDVRHEAETPPQHLTEVVQEVVVEEQGEVQNLYLSDDTRVQNPYLPEDAKVQNLYLENEGQVVQVLDDGGTDFDEVGTDFEAGGSESVHKPSVLTNKEPLINQFKGNFDFEFFKKQIERQIPRQSRLFDLFAKTKFLGLNVDDNRRPILLIGCENESDQAQLTDRFSSTGKSILSGMLCANDCQVIFTCAQPVLLPQKKNSIRRMDA
jgi:hypothetical protein